MKREWLKELGLDDETIEKIIKQNGDDIENAKVVVKESYAGTEAENKALKDTLKERDQQLEELKKSAGESEELRKKIDDLQEANKATTKKHDAEMFQLKVDVAVEKAITARNGKNVTAIKALLDLKDVKLGEDGTVKGLDKQLDTLVTAETSSFMFGSGVPEINGMVQVGAGGAPEADLSKMNYEQLCDYFAVHPDASM